MSNYEAEVEAALAFIELENSAKRKAEIASDLKNLIEFLNDHPDLKAFYTLYQKVKNY